MSSIALKSAAVPDDVHGADNIAEVTRQALAEARANYRLACKRSPMEKANVLSRSYVCFISLALLVTDLHTYPIIARFFMWNTQLMRTGHKHPLQEADLYPLGFDYTAEAISNTFSHEWHKELMRVQSLNASVGSLRNAGLPIKSSVVSLDQKDNPKLIRQPNLNRVLWKSFGRQWAFAGFLKLVSDTCGVLVPVVIEHFVSWLIKYQQTNGDAPVSYAISMVAAMFFLQLVGSLTNNGYTHLSALTGLTVRTAVITAAFDKSLKLSSQARQTWNAGRVTNVISSDSYRMDMVSPFLHMLWAAPVQVIIAAALLITYLGVSALAGIALLALFVPIQTKGMGFITRVRRLSQSLTDKRVKQINELLQGMKIVKFLAWEDEIYDKIRGTRAAELVQITKAAIWKSVVIGVAISVPAIATILTFSLYVALGNSLTSSIVAGALSLLNLIRMPIWQFPQSVAYAIDADVSSKRLFNLLVAEELQSQPLSLKNAPAAIDIQNAEFIWDSGSDTMDSAYNIRSQDHVSSRNQQDYRLREINLVIPHGKLIAVVGRVGSGKSSLLNGIVGEMKCVAGKVILGGSVSYCPQVPWIQNATLKANVLFGLKYDTERYAQTIKMSALERDLELLPGGDATEIGEKGINLSGGQKARINLARSLYAEPDIYLFDDVLSAVDAHVGAYLFNTCIRGALRGKTCILVTHALSYVARCDIIIFMHGGRIAETGTFVECMQRRGEFAELMHTYAGIEDIEKATRTSSLAINEEDLPPGDDVIIEQPIQSEMSEIDLENNLSRNLTSEDLVVEDQIVVVTPLTKLMIDEERALGAVGWQHYYSYIGYSGGWMIVGFVIGLIVLAQVIRVINDLWLAWWSQDTFPNLTVKQYMGIYIGLGVTQATMTLWSNVQLVYSGVQSSRCMHDAALQRVIRAPLSFFDQTPLGRIISRFSKDIDLTDNILYDLFRTFFRSFFMSISIIGIMCGTTPILIAPLVVLVVVYYFIQNFYRSSTRELKRLESITRSPLYAQLGECLTGIVTIRAFAAERRYSSLNRVLMNGNNRPYFLQITAQRWLGVRLELIGNVLTVFSAALGIVQRNSISPALIAVSLSYALQIITILNQCVFQGAEAESQMNSVERLDYYAKEIPNEKPAIVPGITLPEQWPSRATIEFQHLNLAYRSDSNMPPVLKDFTLRVPGGSRVGIVGRTGAGKSTIISALLRLVEPLSGTVVIDGVDITTIGLRTLRSNIAIIPQDPVLFEGTIRTNLDRSNQFDDAHIWHCLQNAGLYESVQAMEKKLDSPVMESGENFSLGERCCLCLARAMTGKQHILIMDEATASVDLETETLIQGSIRRDFENVTILTIAHRLNTVIDYDFILVLDAGCIAEFGHPADLLDNPKSQLSLLVNETGTTNATLLRHMALDAKAHQRRFD